MDAMLKHHYNHWFTDMGHEMFRMYTEMGFPPDMFLDKLAETAELDLLAKVYIVSVYQSDFIAHKRLAGASEANIAKARRTNVEMTERLIKTGELGIY
jgi:hypothetical protein